MYSLPQTFRAELHKKYEFTQELNTKETALFHPLEQGRFLVSIPPPYTAGLCDTIVGKILKAKAELIVTILPSDTSTDWFHRVYEPHIDELRKHAACGAELWDELRIEIEFIKGRLKWDVDDSQSRWKSRIPSVIVVVRN